MARREKVVTAVLLVALALLSTYYAFAAPGGGTISDASTETAQNVSPGSRSDARSTITTMNLNAVQQDQQWKAYVGNVTGSLTLDDANNFTIYDWDLTTITGEVYASRFDNLTWSSVSCASAQQIATEGVFHNMSATETDRLNNTFNWTIHQQFQVGSNTINADTCSSTVTYVNDTRPVPTSTSPFQEILIVDANNYLTYLTSINDNEFGFNNNGTTTRTFDFQMIVGESDLKGSPTTYYFYVELG